MTERMLVPEMERAFLAEQGQAITSPLGQRNQLYFERILGTLRRQLHFPNVVPTEPMPRPNVQIYGRKYVDGTRIAFYRPPPGKQRSGRTDRIFEQLIDMFAEPPRRPLGLSRCTIPR